jgi:hypothetical protein
MASWSMDNWRYVERQSVTDTKGRQWSVALMDILGQEEATTVYERLIVDVMDGVLDPSVPVFREDLED